MPISMVLFRASILPITTVEPIRSVPPEALISWLPVPLKVMSASLPDKVMPVVPARVKLPEIEAAPPTSREVLVSPPALIPSLELVVSSKLVVIDAPLVKKTKPSKAVEPFTSRPPDTNKSLVPDIVPA